VIAMTMTSHLSFRDRFMTLQSYMAFMISKETENVQSSEEIEMAFRTITSQVKQTANFLLFPQKIWALRTGNYWKGLYVK
jgi:hypothetical protein